MVSFPSVTDLKLYSLQPLALYVIHIYIGQSSSMEECMLRICKRIRILPILFANDAQSIPSCGIGSEITKPGPDRPWPNP